MKKIVNSGTMDWSKFKILLVDDEEDILEFLSYNLKNEGFHIYKASNGQEAVRMTREIIPDLVLMDVMMPVMDGIAACREIRSHETLDTTLVAFLSARGEDYSQIAGFDSGGDDYITKPIEPRVLVSRVKAMLKRRRIVIRENNASNLKIVSGELVVDKERYMVVKKGKDIPLPRKEFELLSLLISKPDKVFTREEIFEGVWGENIIVGDRTIDVHIRKLREKLGDKYIHTVKGIGYKYVRH